MVAFLVLRQVQDNEGCNIFGTLHVNKVPGRVAPSYLLSTLCSALSALCSLLCPLYSALSALLSALLLLLPCPL